MTLRGDGLLAIWSDIEAQVETDYQHWLTREHVLERVGVDGFLAGRVFRSQDPAVRRYFITYELQAHDALAGPSYMARLNAPTPWSQRIMPQLQQFKRGGGHVLARAGLGWGGVASPLRFDLAAAGLADAAARQQLVEQLAAFDGVSAVWVLQVDSGATGLQTKEKQMRRSEEGLFDALLCIEGLTAGAVQKAAAEAAARLGEGWQGGVPESYALIYALDKRSAGLTQG